VVDVRVRLVAAVEDAGAISTPVAGINGNGNRANGCDGVQQIIVAVFLKFSEARNLDRSCTSWNFAGSFDTVIFSIRILLSSHRSSAGGVISESDLSSCSVAVASASALVWVRRAGSRLLSGQLQKRSSCDCGGRFYSFSGSKRPA